MKKPEWFELKDSEEKVEYVKSNLPVFAMVLGLLVVAILFFINNDSKPSDNVVPPVSVTESSVPLIKNPALNRNSEYNYDEGDEYEDDENDEDGEED